jgi:peptide/nickel transport system substrate-binding protein
MKTWKWACTAALVAGFAPSSWADTVIKPIEPKMLAPLVSAGKLPPVAERLPLKPMVADMAPKWRDMGQHGGSLRLLMGRSKDIRMLVVYGYARLVAHDHNMELRPDILERYEVEDGRRFRLYLRKGHKWSDGHPFTAEDFRYYWDDIANLRDLAPLGPPRLLVVEGETAQFRVIDETTVEFSWSQPNPNFLPAIAGTTPLYIYRPAHYLKQFHVRYADPKKLKELVRKSRRRNWAALHNRLDNQYKNDNPELPTLQPWINLTKPPAQRFEFTRNPYYHRIDPDGRQLPYIDKVNMVVADSKIIPLKTGAGEADLQARGLHFNNYTFLKEAEQNENQRVRLWRTAKGAQLALFPNLNVNDPVWRKLMRDVRFRRALSLAIDRTEINQAAYFGLALEGNNTVLPGSPLFKDEYQDLWAKLDLRKANQLLDQIGLKERDSSGVRLLPDGRPMEIIVETAGEDTEQTDILELVHDSWIKVGIKLFSRPSQREVFRNRIFAGETLVSIWSGHENGVPTPDTIPDEFAPTSQQQLQWPKWGQHYQTKGKIGEKPDLPAAQELLELNRRWVDAPDRAAREKIWHRMLEINAENVFTIGLIRGVMQPVVVNNRLRNVPEEGVYNWSPGAHFGIYKPDTFWFASSNKPAKH